MPASKDSPDEPQPDELSASREVIAGLRLDRSSPVPLYFQVSEALEAAIIDGRIPPGSRLDNEILLSELLGMSRPTMRRAMQYLVDKGVLVRRRGIGTRVVQPKVRRPLALSSLHDDLAASGRRPSTSAVSIEVVPAPRAVAEALNLQDGAEVIHLVRLRMADAEPLAQMSNYLPADLPGLREGLTRAGLERSGLYGLLRELGVQLHAADQSIGARTASATESRLLGEPRGAAVLTMQRVAYDDTGRAVEFGSHIYSASRYSFTLSMLAT